MIAVKFRYSNLCLKFEGWDEGQYYVYVLSEQKSTHVSRIAKTNQHLLLRVIYIFLRVSKQIANRNCVAKADERRSQQHNQDDIPKIPITVESLIDATISNYCHDEC